VGLALRRRTIQGHLDRYVCVCGCTISPMISLTMIARANRISRHRCIRVCAINLRSTALQITKMPQSRYVTAGIARRVRAHERTAEDSSHPPSQHVIATHRLCGPSSLRPVQCQFGMALVAYNNTDLLGQQTNSCWSLTRWKCTQPARPPPPVIHGQQGP